MKHINGLAVDFYLALIKRKTARIWFIQPALSSLEISKHINYLVYSVQIRGYDNFSIA